MSVVDTHSVCVDCVLWLCVCLPCDVVYVWCVCSDNVFIGAEGAARLAEGLKDCTQLQRLALSSELL